MMLLPRIFNDHFSDGFFDDMFAFPFAGPDHRGMGNFMRTDIQDLGQNYRLEMDLPGFDKQDVHAELHDGYLTISASKETSDDKKDSEGRYVRRERVSGSCQRSFFVGKDLKETDIRAAFENGILKLTFPKEEHREAVEEKRYIAIE